MEGGDLALDQTRKSKIVIRDWAPGIFRSLRQANGYNAFHVDLQGWFS